MVTVLRLSRPSGQGGAAGRTARREVDGSGRLTGQGRLWKEALGAVQRRQVALYICHENGKWRYDLKGPSHYGKSTGRAIPTPHKYLDKYGRPGYMLAMGPVSSMSWANLVCVHWRLLRGCEFE